MPEPLSNPSAASPATIEDTVAVRCQGVVKSYGSGTAKVTALRGIDLEVRPNELMMLVGPSGCGKTTLISVIAGILDQDDGQCEVFGHDFKHMDAAAKTKYRGQKIGFVFQAFNLLPTLNATENAAIPLLINGMRRKSALDRAKGVLDRVGLGDRTDAMPAQLSGGQQQRVAIARALVHDPKLIVCDEPTSSLDAQTGHKIMELLRDVALEEGRSLIIVTHDARIFEFADRIAQMNDGKILKVVQSPAELENH
jgi:putative ABC transport system ATP-binding protein